MTRPKGTKEELENRRLRAVDLLELGHGVREVADVVDVHPGSVSRWKQTYEQEGADGLAPKPRTNGRPPKLAERHYPQLEDLLLEGPLAHGFETDLWTLERIAEIIEREFDVSVSTSSVWRYLRKMGWSSQKPTRRARERDEDQIEHWKNETWPEIKKARAEDRTLVFVDESGFYLNPTVRKTWEPRGHTPIQRSWKRNGRLSVFTALMLRLGSEEESPEVGLFFWVQPDHYNGWTIYEILRDGLRYKARESILILDNWSGHKKAARLLEEAFEGTSLKLDVEYLPPYAPDLNPVEQVWGHTKYGELANYIPDDLGALEARLDRSLAEKSELSELLFSFLKASALEFGDFH